VLNTLAPANNNNRESLFLGSSIHTIYLQSKASICSYIMQIFLDLHQHAPLRIFFMKICSILVKFCCNATEHNTEGSREFLIFQEIVQVYSGKSHRVTRLKFPHRAVSAAL